MTPQERTAERIRKNANIRIDVEMDRRLAEPARRAKADRKLSQVFGQFFNALDRPTQLDLAENVLALRGIAIRRVKR